MVLVLLTEAERVVEDGFAGLVGGLGAVEEPLFDGPAGFGRLAELPLQLAEQDAALRARQGEVKAAIRLLEDFVVETADRRARDTAAAYRDRMR